MRADVVVSMSIVRIDTDYASVVRTNVSRQMVREVLACWLRDQQGRNAAEPDQRTPTEKDTYEVQIGFAGTNADDGCILWIHEDVGENGFLLALVAIIFFHLDLIRVEPLSPVASEVN